MPTVPAPSEIEVAGGTTLRLVWDDTDGDAPDAVTFGARVLRIACRCAACVNEVTGAQMLDPASVAHDIVITDAELVGNYGISPTFSDGHATGIYSWTYLVEVGARLAGADPTFDPDAETAEQGVGE